MLKSFALVAAVAALSLGGVAHANLIVADSFRSGSDVTTGQYPSGTALNNLTLLGTVGAPAGAGVHQLPGWVNGRYFAGGGTAQFSATSGGLVNAAIGATAAGSGKMNYGAAPLDTTVRTNARGLNVSIPSSSSYWVSVLLNLGSTANFTSTSNVGAGWVLTGFGNSGSLLTGASFGTTGLMIGFSQQGSSTNRGSIIIRSRSVGASPTNVDTVLLDGNTNSASIVGVTNLVVAKIDVDVNGAGDDKITWWLNPGNGDGEGALNATAAATGTFNGQVFVQNAANIARFNVGSFQFPGNAFFDEVRFASSLPGLGFAIIPEPSALGLLAPAALLLGRRRK